MRTKQEIHLEIKASKITEMVICQMGTQDCLVEGKKWKHKNINYIIDNVEITNILVNI